MFPNPGSRVGRKRGSSVSGTFVVNAGNAPSLQEGTHAARPAAGTVNRIYIETDTQGIFRDNGVSWDQIGGGNGSDILFRHAGCGGL